MEPIEVTAHFNQEGLITPIHFTWKGGPQRIESTGRRWNDEAGLHILVMVANGRIYQLTFKPTEGRWYLERSESGRSVV